MSQLPLPRAYCVVLLCAALSAAGCASLMATSRPDWNYTDPPWLDPTNQPLVAPTPQMLARPVPDAPLWGSPPPEEDTVPEPVSPPLDEGAGPRLEPPGVSAPLELVVNAPSRKQVGSAIEFRISVWNRSDSGLDDVAIEAEFDSALIFPGRPERRVAQPLGRLAPGDHREIALTLAAEQTGTHCARFLVTVAGVESAWKAVCVELVPRQLGLEIVGPPRRTVGSRAEFNVKLVSTTAEVLRGLQVSVGYDGALRPREASAGARQKPGSMTWNLGDVQPGEGVQLQIEFECGVASESACVVAEVAAENLPAERVEKCLEIVPRGGSIDLRVSDAADPVKVGAETEYVAGVQNRDLRALRDVRLSAEVPVELSVVAAEVWHNDEKLPVDAEIEGLRVVFEPIEVLAPDAVLTYRIRVKGVAAGDGAFAARVTHAASAEATESIEPTTVIRP